MHRLVLTAFALVLCAACSPPAPPFSVANARAHVRMLAGTIGARPTGSDANRRAREYLIDRLREYGFTVRVQETDAERRGATTHLANVIAAKPGRRGQAIALVAHYDSIPDSPGAADNAAGVAVCLEAGRVLGARPSPNYALAVILPDAEELGLVGANAVMKDPIAGWIRAVINFDAVGASGPAVLYETGPGSRVALEAWARSSPRPAGASYMTDIYRLLPNNTDFTVFARANLPGLNFAAAGDGYAYHTSRDAPDRLGPNLLRQMGENTVATVLALDEAGDLSERSNARTVYLDIAGRWPITYSGRTSLILFAAALLAALFGWLTVLPVAREVVRGRPGLVGADQTTRPAATTLLTAVWAPVAVAVVFAAMVAGAWLLRATRETYQPWYAHPDRFFAYLVLAGVLGGWAAARIGRLLLPGMRGSTQPAIAWAIILPFWAALAVAAQIFAPSAAHLAVVPLLAAGSALVILPIRRRGGMRTASAIVLAIAGILWLGDAILLLHFAVATFGRLPIVTPIYVYPALLLFMGLFVVPPLLALLTGINRRPSWHVRAALFILAAAWCWFAPAYTHERPLDGSIAYVHDADTGRARWQIASNEPGVHVGVNAPLAGGWQAGAPPAGFGIPLRLPHGPFGFYGATNVAEPAPVTVTGSLARGPNGVFIDIRVVPLEPALIVDINLPDGVLPEETNLTGRQQEGSNFVARYMAVPSDGVTLRARIGSGDAERLERGGRDARARIVVVRNGLPGAAWPKLPAWLPQEHAAWRARSYFAIPVSLAGGPK